MNDKMVLPVTDAEERAPLSTDAPRATVAFGTYASTAAQTTVSVDASGTNDGSALIGARAATRSCHDVAAYILAKCGAMSAMKLQKLLYYCQAWSLVWDERALFSERIEAWANGPVVPAVFAGHRGEYLVSTWPAGNPDTLDAAARDTVDAVLTYYADRSPQWLSDLAHSERPWQLARQGLPEGERGSREITLASMAEYYTSLE